MFKSIIKNLISSGIVFLLPAMLFVSSCSQGEGDLLDPAKGIDVQGGNGFSTPDAPTNLTASIDQITNSIKLSWDSVPGATQYSISRANSQNGPWTEVPNYTSSSGTNSFEDYLINASSNSQQWYYKVRAFVNGTSSDWSDQAYVPFTVIFDSTYAPAGVNVTSTATSSILINCGLATSVNPVDFQIFRYSNSECTTDQKVFFQNSNTMILTYDDTAVQSGNTYWYKVRSIVSNGLGGTVFSPLSGYKFATVTGGGGTTLSAPSSVTTQSGTNTIIISWQYVTNADYYIVYRYINYSDPETSYSFASPFVYANTGTSYEDSLTSGQSFYYRVKAFTNNNASSAYSSPAVYGITLQPFGAPKNVTATNGDFTDRVEISWSSVTDADGYYIYRSDGIEQQIDTVNSPTNSYNDTTATPGLSYLYRVRAYSSYHGVSDFSTQVTGKMAIRTVFSVTYDGNGHTRGTVPVDILYYRPNDSITIPGNTGNLAGLEIQDGITHRFIGWYTDPTEGSFVSNTYTMGNTDITFYAHYTSDTTTVVGKVGPSGGLVFYDDVADGNDDVPDYRYLEAAPSDITQSGNPIAWYNDAVGYTTTGATGTAVGTGKLNTYTIIQSQYWNPSGVYAADVCDKFYIDVNTGWFLPSTGELQLMDIEIKTLDSGLTDTYWSSTEFDLNNAYFYNMSAGAPGTDAKTWTYKVRPIRAF